MSIFNRKSKNIAEIDKELTGKKICFGGTYRAERVCNQGHR